MEPDVPDQSKHYVRKLLRMLLRNEFGVGNFNDIKRSLSMELSKTNFIITSINKLHSSLQNDFIKFLFAMECDWLPMLNVIVNSEDRVLSNYIPAIINAYVSVLIRCN